MYKRQFFSSAITTLKTLVVAIGAGLGVWGVVNLLEGYGNDNPCLLYTSYYFYKFLMIGL